ncbi:p-hydroxybenzoic acid efflux pump subunit AaeB [Dickeya zeae]|uniref:p-hydroxybenzoic acid efflux pump subunit AaeB n=1 Tax=Dickeya zeae TaxID=204042 RepID=A0ABX8VXX7_9GAMM|nr:p-hydroxybenzoic acid efflux pump subunit AaeB [Dickeya zeae]QYM92637.1 p-hydroxybenzoic acid efflux pump subunit AaeB [Dickeya zeae]
MHNSSLARLRFALKISLAVVMPLLVGFYFQMGSPRTAALTAALVISAPAFVAGGEPFSGAIRHRGILRIIGTFIGCFGALVIIMSTIRAPAVMLLLCCVWAGFCVWMSSLVKMENSYIFALSGYTTLIILLASQGAPQQLPQLAVERCSEIVLGIVCAILADLLFSPRSVKPALDHSVDELLLAQYQFLQRCVNGISGDELDADWHSLVRKTKALNDMGSILSMESSRWKGSQRRLNALVSESWALITQSCEIWLVLREEKAVLHGGIVMLLDNPVSTPVELRSRLRQLRHLAATHSASLPPVLASWLSACARYQLLSRGIKTNARIGKKEEQLLASEVFAKPKSAQTHYAMINGLRTGVTTVLGCLFWLMSGWTSGSVCMLMIAIVTALVARMPNPVMAVKDFLIGAILALPLGALMFMLVLPATQQSALLMCLSIGIMAFVLGIELQKRRIGMMGALVSTLNILALSNPMSFNLSLFLDNALGQIIGCVLALLVVLLIKDNSRLHTGRALLNRFVYGAVSALSTRAARRRENHLPALYQHLFLLLNLFPDDIAKYRLALSLILMHQRLRTLELPVNSSLSAFHRQMRVTAAQVIDSAHEHHRRRHFSRLLAQMDEYQHLLREHQVPEGAIDAVGRLTVLLHRHKHALGD